MDITISITENDGMITTRINKNMRFCGVRMTGGVIQIQKGQICVLSCMFYAVISCIGPSSYEETRCQFL
ncbi:hypothetical protein I7I48_06879 [Histoplasma ohiense]|nr:hypothetical protein I7I48_06879 [Histoplasma ohiense (nom. inval.)]